jgi:hypothetical protein
MEMIRTPHLPFHPGGPKDPMAPADGALERTSKTIPFFYGPLLKGIG